MGTFLIIVAVVIIVTVESIGLCVGWGMAYSYGLLPTTMGGEQAFALVMVYELFSFPGVILKHLARGW